MYLYLETKINICIFAHLKITMTEKRKHVGFYWGMCFVSFIALMLLLVYMPGGFWLGLPTFFGGLVMAMDWV